MRAFTDLARDLPRRRPRRRHVCPHRHDQQVVRRDLQRVAQGHRRCDHLPSGRSRRRTTHAAGLPGEPPRIGSARPTAWRPAAGSVFASGRFVDAKGDPIGTSFAPNFISSLLPPRFESLDYVEGRKPRTPTEASIDTQTADTGDLKLGRSSALAGAHEAQDLRGRRVDEARRHELRGRRHRAGAAPGGAADHGSRRAVRRDLRGGRARRYAGAAARPDREGHAAARCRWRPVSRRRKRQTDDIEENLGFFRIALLVFAGVSLFVGSLPDLQHVLDHGRPANA